MQNFSMTRENILYQLNGLVTVYYSKQSDFECLNVLCQSLRITHPGFHFTHAQKRGNTATIVLKELGAVDLQANELVKNSQHLLVVFQV